MSYNKKKINIAVIGAGSIGQKHIKAIKSTKDANLVAIVDTNNNIDNNVKHFSSINEMFENIKVDGAVVATPNNLHLEHGLKLLNRKCHVLIEKPITTRSTHTKKLINLSKKYKVKILVGHHRRHNEISKKAFELINIKKILGIVRSVHIHCQMFKPDNYFNYDSWRKKEGAGPILVNLIHDIDLMNYLFGNVKSVFAYNRPSLRGFVNEDLSGAIMKFENGIICTILLSDSVVSPWSWEFTSQENSIYPFTKESCYFIGGNKASLSLPNLKIWTHKKEPNWHNSMISKKLIVKKTDPLVAQMQHFIKIIKTDIDPLVDAETANKSLKVIEAIKLSSKLNKNINI